jgi:transcriptional regulator with XRE-family HTH domain
MQKQKIITEQKSKLEILRAELDLKQWQLAEALETTQPHISKLEKKNILPSPQLLERLADKFPMTNFNWLFIDAGKPTYKTKFVEVKILEILKRKKLTVWYREALNRFIESST